MSSTTLPVCPKTGSTSPSLTVHLCLHTAPGNRECARGVRDGRLFRGIGRQGRLHEKLDASQVPRIYKQMARHAGLPDDIVEALGGHSTRVGAVQDMIACGIELPAILQSDVPP